MSNNPIQDTFRLTPVAAVEGASADAGKDAYVISRANPALPQIRTVTVDTVTNSETYTVTINGVAIAITADGSATEAEIVTALTDAINDSAFNGPELAFDVTAEDGADHVTITGPDGKAFTCTVGAKLAVTATQECAGAIPFGKVVANGSTAGTCRLPAASGDSLLGIALFDYAQPILQGALGSQYEAGVMVSIARKDRVWVKPEDPNSVTLGGAVYARYKTGAGGSQRGAIRTDGDTSSAAQLTGAEFASLPDADGLCIVEINKP